jgi:hypothetical protein
MFGFVVLLCHPIKNVLTQLQFFLFFAQFNLDKLEDKQRRDFKFVQREKKSELGVFSCCVSQLLG